MIKRLKSKRGFDLPFSWIFAIIAGAFIILISIYATTKFINVGKNYGYALNAKTIDNILGPVVNGLASGSAYPPIQFNKETRIYLGCEASSSQSPLFGRQTLGFSEESGLGKKWTPPENNISRYNKYVFGRSVMQAKKFYIFSKPFFLGYKVEDLVYFIPASDNYCFVNAPENVEYTMRSFGFSNINLTTRISSCPTNSIITCFDFSDSFCEIKVEYDNSENPEIGRIIREGTTDNYAGESLLYAGIFSSADIYRCNIARLGIKINILAKIYLDKIELVREKDCGSLIEPHLNFIAQNSNSMTSQKLGEIYDEAVLMNQKNCDASCPIYACESAF